MLRTESPTRIAKKSCFNQHLFHFDRSVAISIICAAWLLGKAADWLMTITKPGIGTRARRRPVLKQVSSRAQASPSYFPSCSKEVGLRQLFLIPSNFAFRSGYSSGLKFDS